ncbi:hypothetical protein CR513_56355, partial [Mucuna pruriens]
MNSIPTEYECHHLRPQDLAVFGNLPSQIILNPRGNASVVSLRSGRELPQTAPQQRPRSTDADSEPNVNSQVPQPDKSVPLPFPTRTLSTRKPESDEELLKMFRKVEINIPLLDTIKQIPKYAKFLKELCVHKRRKIKEGVELGGIMLTLTKNDDIIVEAQQGLPKKCRDPRTSHPPLATLTNRSVVQPLGILKDVLVQVNELIFPTNFYVLDMKDETSGKGSTLILGDHS